MDIKGDLSGCARIGEMNENIEKRVAKLGLDEIGYELKKFPIRFWDVYGDAGHPIRLTVSDMGATLLSIILGLSEAGESLLSIAFQIAKDQGQEIIDLKDLKLLLQDMSENAKELSVEYGNINPTSLNTVVRKITVLEGDNGTKLFGEPNLDLKDLMKITEESGSGYINIIECRELVKKPTLYASLLVYLLSSFYEKMPEVGDLDKPKAVLFLDEAHLIFSEMSNEVVKKITQIIKLIRSKGISVFFISQSPADIPNEILGQLGNRVQHCLRAYTPQELKAVKTAASTLRENPEIDTEKAILELGTGEALVSFVDEEGMPGVVELAKILPPQSYMGEITKEEMDNVISNSVMETKYREAIDRESAFEKLSAVREEKEAEKKRIEEEKEAEKKRIEEEKAAEKAKKEEEKRLREEERLKEKERKEQEKAEREAERARKNSVGYKLGKKVVNKAADKAINKGLNSLLKHLIK
jgi:DNA helicase HerA-like ATPase